MATISADFINPFLIAGVRILENTCGSKIKVGQLFSELSAEKKYCFVTFNIHGAVKGKVAFAFDKKASVYILEKMLYGYKCDRDDTELFESTLCELCNVIIGNAAMLLEKNDIAIMISTPILMHDNSADAGFKVIRIPLVSEIGDIILCFLLQVEDK